MTVTGGLGVPGRSALYKFEGIYSWWIQRKGIYEFKVHLVPYTTRNMPPSSNVLDCEPQEPIYPYATNVSITELKDVHNDHHRVRLNPYVRRPYVFIRANSN